MTRVPLEICVDTIEGARIAAENGADRIELCTALSEGGLTPSAGMMAAASRLPVPVYAMIRPRSGNFGYSDAEKTVMLRDIMTAEENGMSGIVIGAIDDKRRLDRDFLSLALRRTALPATLHRAFDALADMSAGMEDAVELGFERVLTSGRQLQAVKGLDALAYCVDMARGRISIMAGAGVKAENAALILRRAQVDELHASCSAYSCAPAPDEPEIRLGFVDRSGAKSTSAESVRALREVINDFAAIGP